MGGGGHELRRGGDLKTVEGTPPYRRGPSVEIGAFQWTPRSAPPAVL
jgi:hypothetical protein